MTRARRGSYSAMGKRFTDIAASNSAAMTFLEDGKLVAHCLHSYLPP